MDVSVCVWEFGLRGIASTLAEVNSLVLVFIVINICCGALNPVLSAMGRNQTHYRKCAQFPKQFGLYIQACKT